MMQYMENSLICQLPMESRIRREVYVRFGGEGKTLAYAAAIILKEFKGGKLSLGVDDIGRAVASQLTGAATDQNGVLISSSEDGGKSVAVGFRAKKANGKYRYVWLYRVKFGIPNITLSTKGENITFSTPTIEGTISRRNKLDGRGNHPWKAEVN